MTSSTTESLPRRLLRALFFDRRVGNVVLLVLLLTILYAFAGRGMRFFLVPSESMVPTLQRGDYIVTVKRARYPRGSIVVLHDPETKGDYLVKRIAGVPGDTVMVIDGALLINGVYASEPYVREPPEYLAEPYSVPPGEVFLLGDNRNESEDSARWNHGLSAGDIVGEVVFIYYPFARAGRVAPFPLRSLEEVVAGAPPRDVVAD